jgi:HNH endonuclease
MTPFLEEYKHRWKKDSDTGCFIWIGATAGSKGKRPQVKRFGKRYYVARLVCTEANGPPPDGQETSHSCHNGMCISDAHVRWATHNDNMLESRWV